MASKTGGLAGKVLFISGASRGIGKAIALRAAGDGAKVIIAAKTKEQHPTLPGTIYSAAEEIEKAGGQCLPCVVDIRDEAQVLKAVETGVSKFGGIDIVVNNASAISLTGTSETPMKRYDLMNQVNARGTYLCSKSCLPYLKKAVNPHILNISPPLSMNPVWFKNHVAYTIAKYGMSMCVLGMAEEFRAIGIAVNALWPKTAIYTAATEMLGGGEAIKSGCRKPEIVSDAAYAILTQPSKQITGNFFIDEVALKDLAGVTDFEHYSCVPGSKLHPDFFVDENIAYAGVSLKEMVEKSSSSSLGTLSPGQLQNTLSSITKRLNPEVVKQIGGSFVFQLKGSEPALICLDLKSGVGSVAELSPQSFNPDLYDCVMTLTSDDFCSMFNGKMSPTAAFFEGKLQIKGNMMVAMKLEKLLKQAKL